MVHFGRLSSGSLSCFSRIQTLRGVLSLSVSLFLPCSGFLVQQKSSNLDVLPEEYFQLVREFTPKKSWVPYFVRVPFFPVPVLLRMGKSKWLFRLLK